MCTVGPIYYGPPGEVGPETMGSWIFGLIKIDGLRTYQVPTISDECEKKRVCVVLSRRVRSVQLVALQFILPSCFKMCCPIICATDVFASVLASVGSKGARQRAKGLGDRASTSHIFVLLVFVPF